MSRRSKAEAADSPRVSAVFFPGNFGQVERLCPNLLRSLVVGIGVFAFEGYSKGERPEPPSKTPKIYRCVSFVWLVLDPRQRRRMV